MSAGPVYVGIQFWRFTGGDWGHSFLMRPCSDLGSFLLWDSGPALLTEYMRIPSDWDADAAGVFADWLDENLDGFGEYQEAARVVLAKFRGIFANPSRRKTPGPEQARPGADGPSGEPGLS